MMDTTINLSIDAIWRSESAKIIAALTRIMRDVGLAEDLAQDSLLIALERWPQSGIPDKPVAWLMATAKRRAIDLLRRNKLSDRKYEELGYELNAHDERDFDFGIDDYFGDDLLRLIFMTCHPILSAEARAALTLRLLGGLTTKEIANAYLILETTVAQRISRAKRALSEMRVPFRMPSSQLDCPQFLR
jgi:RNA polymerase sigma factor (sigma-70 family)